MAGFRGWLTVCVLCGREGDLLWIRSLFADRAVPPLLSIVARGVVDT